MYITNVTDYDSITDYDNITSLNDISTLCYCTNNDNNGNNIEIIIPVFTIFPCGMSLICLISLMVYTLIKPLFNIKEIIINEEVSLSNSSSLLYHNRT